MKRVKVNATYRYVPNMMDRLHNLAGLTTNDVVKVINMHGCPPANTMGQCYIEKDGKFIGMVSVHSLHNKKCSVQVDENGKIVDEKYCTC